MSSTPVLKLYRFCELNAINDVIDFLEQYPDHDQYINRNTIYGGNTCLHVATKNGYAKLVEILLDYGADMHVLNDVSETLIDKLWYLSCDAL
jgi:hypothetical protein